MCKELTILNDAAVKHTLSDKYLLLSFVNYLLTNNLKLSDKRELAPVEIVNKKQIVC